MTPGYAGPCRTSDGGHAPQIGSRITAPGRIRAEGGARGEPGIRGSRGWRRTRSRDKSILPGRHSLAPDLIPGGSLNPAVAVSIPAAVKVPAEAGLEVRERDVDFPRWTWRRGYPRSRLRA